MPSFKFPTSIGGEISPELQTRTEIQKRLNGMALCRNFTVDRFGSASNRAGLEFMASTKDQTVKSVWMPFILNKTVAFSLELGNNYMRVFDDGVQLKDTSIGVYNAATVYTQGVIVSFSGTNYSSKHDTNLDMQPDISAASWHPMVSNIIEFFTPWLTADLFELEYAQSGNFIRITNNGYPVFEIERSTDLIWIVKQLKLYPEQDFPDFNGTNGAAGALIFNYKVTSVGFDGEESTPGHSSIGGGAIVGVSPTNEVRIVFLGSHTYAINDEIIIKNCRAMPQVNGKLFKVGSVPSVTEITLNNVNGTGWVESGTSVKITAGTAANPVEITTVNDHGFATGDDVYIHSVTAMTQINNRLFTITKVSDTKFTLDGEDGTAYTPAADGIVALTEPEAIFGTGETGCAGRTTVQLVVGALPTLAAPHVISMSAQAGVAEFNIYKENEDGLFGFIGITTNTVFNDIDITPDVAKLPPSTVNVFNTANDYPAAVSHYQQRLCLGNLISNVELFNSSRTGDVRDFTRRVPLQTDDPVKFSLRGREVGEIRHIMDLDDLIIFTEGGEWVVRGDSNGSLVPTNPNPKQGGYRGADTVRPIVVGKNAVYVQNRTGAIRDLRFDSDNGGYVGIDLTEFASHLFFNKSVKQWAYQQIPNSIIWAAMDDGNLIAMTYIPERDVWAWHRHDSNGAECESIISIPENGLDTIYATFNRTINGSTVRYQERLNNRVITDLAIDAIFLDSYFTYDGRNTGATTLTITGGPSWAALENLTLTASVAEFVSGDVGKFMVLRVKTTAWDQKLGKNVVTVNRVKGEIIGFTSTTIVTFQPETAVPTALQGVATTDWGKAINVVTGLDHLEAEVVSAYGDGNVVPGFDEDDNAVAGMTVDGSFEITLPDNQFYEIIHVGLQFYSDYQTLDIDSVQGETLIDKVKIIKEVTVVCDRSKDFFVGSNPDNLIKTNDSTGADATTGNFTRRVESTWGEEARVFIRQKDPTPLTIVSIIASGEAEGVE